MITALQVENFKSITKQKFIMPPLTILTGTNSSGKSSVIQALLLYSNSNKNNLHLENYLNELGETNDWLNYKTSEKEFKITPIINDRTLDSLVFNQDKEGYQSINNSDILVFEKNLFYLNANRLGQENIAARNNAIRSGCSGEYLFGFYEYNKNEKIKNEDLIFYTESDTLSAQVNFWINKILDLNLILQTQRINHSNVLTSYKNHDLDGKELSPFNLGAGVSYLTKIIILGLSLKKDNLFIIENPEVHLHPKAISKLAEFFVFLANAGVQIILETHSEHVLNKMRWEIFKGHIEAKDIQIYYRENTDKDFIPIKINKRGKYIDENEQVIEFPQGFFDSDLGELLEMA